MEPTVSIIVPVYNAENTIPRCIESILNQEYSDFELLLVNDGSTDGSGAVCDAYAARDARVRVIHKENTGVSDTRNTALDQARGTYLQFLTATTGSPPTPPVLWCGRRRARSATWWSPISTGWWASGSLRRAISTMTA